MTLDKNQVMNLMQFVASVTEDGLTCDKCFEQVPELAESQLGNKPLDEVLLKVKTHIDNCPCCDAEYKSFLEALHEIDSVS
ncbi:MAG: hypothetical protein AB8G99_00970 [Planctomycetaceae bacterium]